MSKISTEELKSIVSGNTDAQYHWLKAINSDSLELSSISLQNLHSIKSILETKDSEIRNRPEYTRVYNSPHPIVPYLCFLVPALILAKKCAGFKSELTTGVKAMIGATFGVLFGIVPYLFLGMINSARAEAYVKRQPETLIINTINEAIYQTEQIQL